MKIYNLDRKISVKDGYDHSVLNGLTEGREFTFNASRYEYFVVQLLVLTNYDASGVEVVTSPLTAENGKQIEKVVTCFNTKGTDAQGVKFKRSLPLKRNEIKPVFIGVNLQKADLGRYSIDVKIGDENVKLYLNVNDELVFNNGYDNGSNLARLDWLNSTAYRNKKIIKGYEAIGVEKNILSFTGKKVSFTSDGLIENVQSYFGESNALSEEGTKRLFSRPVELQIEGQKVKYNKVKLSTRVNRAYVQGDGRSEKLKVEINASAGYEGMLSYDLKITAEKDAILPSVNLNMYFSAHDYLVGLGKEGGRLTEDVEYRWSEARPAGNVFIGDINCGAVVRFKNSESARTPIYDLYSATPIEVPRDTWDNYGQGSLSLVRTNEGATLTARTGRVIIKAGESKHLYFDIALTPFKPLSLKEMFGNRLSRDGVELTYAAMLTRAKQEKLDYVCLRNAGVLNPYINYPFDKVEELKTLAMEAHRMGLGMGISYGLRDMSTRAQETFAFKALGDEIIYRTEKNEGTEKALIDYLGDGVVEADKKTFLQGELGMGKDISYYTTPHSRIDNFFVEGVNYLVKYADLDAISMVDPTLSRDTVERVAKCVASKRSGRGVIELGVSNRFNAKNGYTNSLTTYMDVLPFINKLYMDKGYDFSRDADYILTEVSGLIYGMSADSHFEAGITRSLIYGMMPKFGDDETVSRALGDINKLFKDFDIENAELKGFWDKTNPIKVDNTKVYCTSYIKDGNMIAIFYNSNDVTTTFEVGVENKFGYTTLGKKVRAPEIEGLQSARKINFGKPLKLKAHQGMIVYVKK